VEIMSPPRVSNEETNIMADLEKTGGLPKKEDSASEEHCAQTENETFQGTAEFEKLSK